MRYRRKTKQSAPPSFSSLLLKQPRLSIFHVPVLIPHQIVDSNLLGPNFRVLLVALEVLRGHAYVVVVAFEQAAGRELATVLHPGAVRLDARDVGRRRDGDVEVVAALPGAAAVVVGHAPFPVRGRAPLLACDEDIAAGRCEGAAGGEKDEERGEGDHFFFCYGCLDDGGARLVEREEGLFVFCEY